MGTITSSVGLVSGLNTGLIIDELMSLESQPVNLLQTRISSTNAQMQAYSDMETQLSSLQSIGLSLELPSTFHTSVANSSDPTTLTATTTTGATQGSYTMQVAQLVSAQQSISSGYTSADAPLQAGTISFELGGGGLSTQTSLSQLNGGAGVTPGQFRITDASGKSDVIDTSSDITLDNVVSQINTSLNVSVKASIKNNKLVLTDGSSGSGTLTIQDTNGGTTAKDLGIAGTATAGTLTGSPISYLSNNTPLAALNDGRGIQTRTSGTSDFNVTLANGTSVGVDLAGAQTLGDVIADINKASPGKLKASIPSGSSGIQLSDLTSGGGSFSASNANGSTAATDLGIAKTGSGGTLSGKPIIAGLDSVLISSLKGGSGIGLGTIAVTDRGGHSANIDLSGASSFQDLLDTINNAGLGVNAALNSAGNGIQLSDTSGNGNLVVSDVSGGTTAQSLGINGTFDNTKPGVAGGDLHLQYVSANTLLTDFNGGKGVAKGTFSIQNSAGGATTIDLTQGTFNTIGDVLKSINSAHAGVTASINSNGNGILLADTSGGAGKLTVREGNSTTAKDLNLIGTATATTIDGSMARSITINAGDTLNDVVSKIGSGNYGIGATVINDGSSTAPYRLSLTSLNAGKDGRVLIDTGATGLSMRTLVKGQDAAVFVGGSGASQPLLVTSNKNQLTGIIPGVSVSLLSASNKPVTLSITRDPSSVSTQLQTFVDGFNSLVDKLTTYTQFDSTNNQGGLLLGDATAQQIQTQMYAVFSTAVKTSGSLHTTGDVGITITDGGKLKYDATAFTNAFTAEPDDVTKLFTDKTSGLGTIIGTSITSLVDPSTGTLTQENTILQNQNQQFQDQIKQLDSILADKRNRLEEQFSNMETVLSGLQSQGSALNSITTITAPTTTKSSSSSSG